MKRGRLLLAVGSLALLSGCDGGEPPAAPIVRPVLSVVAELADQRKRGFAGVVQPRYQTDRAFQVLGRIITRNVDVGDFVKTGQTIATNDPMAYQLAVRSAQSELVTANSQLEKTSAQRLRTLTLVKQGVSSQAVLDGAQQAVDAASASVQQAEARLAKAKEQLGYTTLTADLDGVVTGVYAEVGQIASPGMRIMTLARTDVREAVVDVPDDIARTLEPGAPFDVSLQADPSVRSSGKVREIAPDADVATRLRRIRITLDRPQEAFRLGATVSASPETQRSGSSIELPQTAVFQRDGANRVWLVDGNGATVRSVVVEIADRDGRTVRLSAGVSPGERVVTAGANSLSEGQAVRTGKEP